METDLAKPEWGLKRTCLGCGERFYDMQREPIVCPSCEAEFDPLALVRPRRARAAASQAKAKAAEKAVPEEAAVDDEDALVDDDALDVDVDVDIDLEDDDDDDLLPDDDDDDTDDPDVSEVVEKAKDGEKDSET